MKKLKTQKGITLIALIITIVVLLILAVVAIGAVQDSNIIAHAQNAASTYKQAGDNEVGILSKYEQKIESIIFKERKYVGQGMTVIWKANNIVDIYQKGELIYANVQSKEIPRPDEDGAEEYSRFFEITLDGKVIRSALSKDESVLVIEGIGTLNEVKDIKGEYPIAYRGRWEELNADITIVIVSEEEAIMYTSITNSDGQTGELATKVKKYSYAQAVNGYEVINQYGKEYSYALVTEGSGRALDAAYCSEDNVWVQAGMNNGKVDITKLVYYPIELSAEEMNSIIEKAN